MPFEDKYLPMLEPIRVLYNNEGLEIIWLHV